MNPFLTPADTATPADTFTAADPAVVCAIRLAMECKKRRENERDALREKATPAVERRANRGGRA